MPNEYALNQLSDEFLRVLELLEDDDFSDEEAIKKLEELQFQIDLGCEQLVDYIDDLTSNKTCIKDKQDLLNDRKKRFDNKVKRLKKLLLTLIVKHGNPTKTGGYNIKTAQLTISATAEKEKIEIEPSEKFDLENKINRVLNSSIDTYMLMEETEKESSLKQFEKDVDFAPELQQGMTFNISVKGLNLKLLLRMFNAFSEEHLETKVAIDSFSEDAINKVKIVLIELERINKQFKNIGDLNAEFSKYPESKQKLMRDVSKLFSLTHDRSLKILRS